MRARRRQPKQRGLVPRHERLFLRPGPAFHLCVPLSRVRERGKFLDVGQGKWRIEVGGSSGPARVVFRVAPAEVRRRAGVQCARPQAEDMEKGFWIKYTPSSSTWRR